jgi:hypothetical protein
MTPVYLVDTRSCARSFTKRIPSYFQFLPCHVFSDQSTTLPSLKAFRMVPSRCTREAIPASIAKVRRFGRPLPTHENRSEVVLLSFVPFPPKAWNVHVRPLKLKVNFSQRRKLALPATEPLSERILHARVSAPKSPCQQATASSCLPRLENSSN